MRIPDAVADPDPATQKIVPKIELLILSLTLCDKKLKFLNILLLFTKSVYFKDFLCYYLARYSSVTA
jgi:hypothetical protein